MLTDSSKLLIGVIISYRNVVHIVIAAEVSNDGFWTGEKFTQIGMEAIISGNTRKSILKRQVFDCTRTLVQR